MSKEDRKQPHQLQPVLASVVSSFSSSPSPVPGSASSFPSSSSSQSSSGSSSPSPMSSHSHSPRGDPDAARVKHRNNETTRRRQMQKQFNRLRAVTGAGRKEDRVSILSKAAKQLEHCMRAHGGAHASPADELQQHAQEQEAQLQQQAAQQADAAAVHDLSGLPLSLSFGSSRLNAMLPLEQESSSQQLMMMQPLPHTASYGCVPMSPSSSSSSPAAYLFQASFLPPSLYSRQSTFVYGLESSSGSASSAASLSSSSSSMEQRLRSPSPEPFTLQQTSSLSSSLTHSTASLDLMSSLLKQDRTDSGLSQQMAASAAGAETYDQQTSSSSSSGSVKIE
jgi:hypothetical protein